MTLTIGLDDKADQLSQTITQGSQQMAESLGGHSFYKTTLSPLFAYSFLNNPVSNWLLALGMYGVVLLALTLVKRVLFKRLVSWCKSQSGWIKLLAGFVNGIKPWVFQSLALSIASLFLTMPAWLEKFIHALPVLAVLAQLAFWGRPLINFITHGYFSRVDDERMRLEAQTVFNPLKFVVLVLLWGVLGLIGLKTLGFDITALVAGLGIGGVAVALAVQNVLGDLFAALSIAIDKPFVIGDFVVVGEYKGTIENIGLKTTRIRSLGGEQIIVSNSDLLSSRIRNFKRLTERRVVFNFGVLYDTTPEQLKAIPAMVISAIDKAQSAGATTRFDRAHFYRFGESALEFEAVYFVCSTEYNVCMDVQQAVNLDLFNTFKQAGIGFAFPSRTVYINPPTHQPVGELASVS
jgi:small-conductance mechanosensitive channel